MPSRGRTIPAPRSGPAHKSLPFDDLSPLAIRPPDRAPTMRQICRDVPVALAIKVWHSLCLCEEKLTLSTRPVVRSSAAMAI
jgi:hypothetical protein